MKISIDKIKVAARIRKDAGKIEELAENIREHGLITPIAVMRLDDGAYQLLAGLRRLRAMERNGESEIDTKVFPSSDAEAALKIEYFENEQREPFTFSEKMDYARLLEDIELAKATGRQAEGRVLGGATSGNGRQKDGCLGLVRASSNSDKKKARVREVVGAKINMSGMQYDRAKYIAQNAPPDVIDALDRDERTIFGTYTELRAKEKAATAATPDVSPRPESSGDKPAPVTHSKPEQSPRPRARSVKTDPFMEKLRAEEAEAIQTRRAFDALSPEDKIVELRRQLKEARTRAADAESKLAREKVLRQNEMYHYTATIEMLQNQLARAAADNEAAE